MSLNTLGATDFAPLIALYNTRRYAELESQVKVLLATYPDAPFAWQLLGGALQMQGKDALAAFQKVAALSPNDAGAHFNLGVAFKTAGQLEAAVASYRRALVLQPRYFEALSNLGGVLQDLSRFDEAVLCYQDALVLQPSAAGTHNSLGTALKNSGRLEEAVGAYRAALKIKSDYADAYYNLGNALKELGRLDEAVQSYRQAIQFKPRLAEAHSNLGSVLKELGNVSEALLCYQRAIEIDPSFVEALSNLGAVFREASRVDEALVCFQKALTIQPDSAELHSNLALVLYDLKEFKLSMAQCQLALTLNSNYAEAHNNLGLCFKAMGQLNEAAESYRRAITCDANSPSAHSNLGNVLREIGQYNNAITSYQQAIKLQPNFAEAYSNLGGALQCLGQFDLAIANCQRALEINPNYAEALNNLGLCLKAVGQTDAAITSYRRAIICNPSFASAYSNLGNALNDTGQLEEALNSYRKAVEINPNFAEAHNNLGCALKDIAQFDNALVSYRKALEINPTFPEAYSNLLFCLNHSELVSAQDLFAEHLLFAKQFETPLKANWLKHNNSQEPNRCLRVGFVSADLRSHAVAYFFEAVLVHLAKSSQLSLHAYYNHTVEDSVTQQLKKYLPNWHSIAGLSDDELARKIRLDDIDILYDLSGHTAKHRLLTFARKPAPIQISWMGYPSTTGLTAMDYYQSDRLLFPDDRFDSQFTEKIIRLPASSAFLPSKEAPPVNTLPALSNGYITFGSFNRLSKISHSVVKLWAQLLRALPDSRMLLGAMPQDDKHQTLVEWFAQEGIPQTRLIFHMRSNMADYLNLHHKVDICLDTFPYSGGTTTFHALWMGVPTLTLGGQTMAGWVGVSILGHVGLESFAAFNTDDFVQKGIAWANNLEELSDVRRGLRERFVKSARGQPALIAAAMERALRIIWQRWCEGLPAKAIEVSTQELSSQ